MRKSKPGQNVRIADVAKRAGVSTATVSHVVNETRPVLATTRQRVLQAVEALGYRPSLVARGLRRRRTRTVGILVPDLFGSFFPALLRGLEDRLRANGYMYFLGHSDEDPHREMEYLRSFLDWQVDGLIVAPAIGRKVSNADLLLDAGKPIVFVDRRPEVVGLAHDAFPSVGTDNRDAAYQATSHLIGQGFERIAVVSPNTPRGPVAERVEGYRAALAAAGLSPISVPFRGRGKDAGQSQAEQLLDLEHTPAAIFATTNSSGLGAYAAIQARHLRVPEDIGLVIFDDSDWAELGAGVSAVRTEPRQMGHLAASTLLDLLQNKKPSEERITVPARLVVRQSTRRAGADQTEGVQA